jgi:hypothetical protein
MVDRNNRATELSEGHEEQKSYARLAHSELRAKGIQRFRDDAGREYWVSDNVLQIIMPDGSSEARYSLKTDSIMIKGEGAQ